MNTAVNIKKHCKSAVSSFERGVSLVELMISMTIGLIILAGVIQLYVSSRQSSDSAQATSRIQENVRFSMQTIGEDIYRAGSMGCFSFAAAGTPVALSSISSATADGADSVIGQLIHNRVFNDADNDGLNDVADTTVVGGVVVMPDVDASPSDYASSFISGVDGGGIVPDTLIIKYLDTSAGHLITATNNDTTLVVDNTNLAGGLVGVNRRVVAGSCQGIYVFDVGAEVDNGDTTTTITLNNGMRHGIDVDDAVSFLYAGGTGSYTYFIGASVANPGPCALATPLNCSLFRTSSNGAPQELVLGVSNLQIRYFYDNGAVTTSIAAPPVGVVNTRLTVDRVEVTMIYNAQSLDLNGVDFRGAANTRTYTRVFAVRNQL